MTARLSLTMIVKNEAATLATCLASVAGIVDEIIVVDTGSTDGTQDIARQHGARVFDLPWPDSFAAARNESLRHARGQWLLCGGKKQGGQRELCAAVATDISSHHHVLP